MTEMPPPPPEVAELDARTMRVVARALDIRAERYNGHCPCLTHKALSAELTNLAGALRTWAFSARGGAVTSDTAQGGST